MENCAHTLSRMPHLLLSHGTLHHAGLLPGEKAVQGASHAAGVADLGKHLHGSWGQQAKVFPPVCREIAPSFLGGSEGMCMVGNGEAASVFPTSVSPGEQWKSLYLNGSWEEGIMFHLKSVLCNLVRTITAHTSHPNESLITFHLLGDRT